MKRIFFYKSLNVIAAAIVACLAILFVIPESVWRAWLCRKQILSGHAVDRRPIR